jgi:hypothetical protein
MKDRKSKSQTPVFFESHLDAFPGVEFGADVEVEVEGFAWLALVLAGVKVDDIVDVGAAAVDDPVVSVEGLGVAQDGVEACSGSQCLGLAHEGNETGTTASGRQVSSSMWKSWCR